MQKKSGGKKNGEKQAERTVSYFDAKSIHIYAWPFRLKESETAASFSEQLEQKGWTEKELEFQKLENAPESVLREAYMREQYFSGPAKNIFLRKEHRICRVYEYDLDPFGEGKKYYYRIRFKDNIWSEGRYRLEEKTYDLLMTSIELHVYEHGVGILFLNTLNMDRNTTLADIKQINDKGRSISLPFLPAEQEGEILCPDKLGVVRKNGRSGEEEELAMTDFRKRIRNVYGKNTEENRQELSRPAEFLEDVLNINLGGNGENTITVVPVNDYRMFVISMIRDNDLSEKMGKKEWRDSVEGEETWYSVLYVDPKDPTCQHGEMRRSLLSEAAYLRWADWGSVYGATNYSFIGVTTEDSSIDASVVLPFYAEYTYMVSLVLAQRMSLMRFSEESGQLAEYMNNTKKRYRLIARKACNRLVDLQEEYIIWKSSMMILEFTCQDQGLELYRLLQKQLLVEKEKEVLDEQMQGLYEAVNVSNGTRVGWWGLLWAVLAIVLAVPPLFDEGSSVRELLECIWNAVKSIS